MEKEKLLKPQELLIIAIGLMFTLLIAGGFYFYFQKIKEEIVLIKEKNEFQYQKRSVPIIPESPSDLTPKSSPDVAMDWKIYQNEKYLFKINYPNNWYKVHKINDSSENIIIFQNEDQTTIYDFWLSIGIFEHEADRVNIWFENEKKLRSQEEGYKELIIAGQPAIKFIRKPTPQYNGQIIYQFAKEKNTYILTILYKQQSDGIGDRIVSTFQFIE